MFIMRKYEMLGFFVISLISIALSLAFRALPSNLIFDGIGPTSDSLWQVGKLMFISILIYATAEYFVFGHRFDNFTFAKAATLFISPLIYIGLSYFVDYGLGGVTFNGHVMTFAIALVIGQYLSYFILRDGFYFQLMNGYAVLGILLMLGIYISFGSITDTFNSPIFKTMDGYKEHIKRLQ